MFGYMKYFLYLCSVKRDIKAKSYAVKKINSVGTSECNDRGMLTTLRETFSGVMSARQGVYKTESKEAANSLV